MMKHLQKPAVQMLLLVAVIGIAGGVFYLTKQRSVVSANNAAPAAPGAKPTTATSTIVAEERKVDLADKRVSQSGGSQVQPLVVQKRKPPAPTLISTRPTTSNKPPKPPPFPKLVHITNTAPEPYKDEEPKLFAPRGLLIKAALVLTVDSSSLETPVLALVSEDVYWNQKLILPAGTQVQAKAAQGRTRDRIEVKGQYTFIWADGREYNIGCIALDHDRAEDGSFGITDGSAGIRGQIVKNDQYAEMKVLFAEAISGLMNNSQNQFQSIYGLAPQNSGRNAALGGGGKAASAYSGLLTKQLEKDLDFVRVSAGTQFYIYTLAVFEPEMASIAGLKQGGRDVSSWQLNQEAYQRASAQAATGTQTATQVSEATRQAEEEKRSAERAARVSALLSGSATPAGSDSAESSTDSADSLTPTSSNP
jgi:Bacterial conjugation TrbI-like protein